MTPRVEQIPLGTVTLLFTDVEGSTRLWEQHPESMHDAIALHDRLLQAEIEARGGYVFKTVGDAFCAAFDSAPPALEAALALQRALRDATWGVTGALKVRAALHTGAVQERGGDYFGPPLNRVARLLSAGHGGQVLLSLTAAELVRDALPPGVDLRDLGERRLKDLARPERVYQVVAPDLPQSFPPLKTLDARRNNLPSQPSPLIGREAESVAIRQRLMEPETRLLTLTGPGGTGKTRLSLQVAADVLDEFDDGVFFVPLANVFDADVVPDAIAQALEVRERGDEPTLVTVKNALRSQHALLVLDNFEQVTSAAPAVGALLAACPRVKILVTSRIVLRVYGEREFPVPPLSLPEQDFRRTMPSETAEAVAERLSQYEAVRLFIERAADARPGFTLTPENAAAVAEICWRVDGLPLAIELAAARVKLFAPEALLTRLKASASSLQLLTGGARDRPARQQTLRNLIAWSWDLLDSDEQALFRRLGVFVGGCTVDAAEAVVLPLDLDVLDGLTSLVDKSLIRQEDAFVGGQPSDPRFWMLQTIQEFSVEQLDSSGEGDALRAKHAAFYLALAEEAQQKIQGPQQAAWLDRLEHDHDNLRATLRWFEARGDGESALRLAAALWSFWLIRGHLHEGRQHLERLLSLDVAAAHTAVRARVLNGAGTIATQQGHYAAARGWFEDSLAIWRELGEEARAAGVLLNLGLLMRRQHDYETAQGFLTQSLDISQRLGNQRGIAHALNNLALVAMDEGDLDRARDAFHRSLEINRSVGDQRNVAASLTALASLSLFQGTAQDAARYCKETLLLLKALRDRRGLAEALGVAGCIAVAQGQPSAGLRLAGAADALREAIGATLPPSHQGLLERWLTSARQSLDPTTADQAWSHGRSLSPEDALAAALQ